MKYLIIVIAVIISYMAVGQFNSAEQERQGAEVLAVCNSSRMVTSHADEADCGQLQDLYGVEFICESNDNNVSTKCWVEEQ